MERVHAHQGISLKVVRLSESNIDDFVRFLQDQSPLLCILILLVFLTRNLNVREIDAFFLLLIIEAINLGYLSLHFNFINVMQNLLFSPFMMLYLTVKLLVSCILLVLSLIFKYIVEVVPKMGL
jgi:hypothetical protein